MSLNSSAVWADFVNILLNRSVYDELVANGTIIPAQEVPPPTVPMDYSWARVRNFIITS